MKHYMSTAQVADELGITRDALKAKIRANTFVAPDVVIGDRFQGWAPATIAEYAAEPNNFYCDPDGLAVLITDVRRIAERIRTFGGQAPWQPGIGTTMPMRLHQLAGTVESVLRSMVVADERVGEYFESEKRSVPARPIDFVHLGCVESVVPTYPLEDDVRARELRQACQDLDGLISRLPEILTSRTTRPIGKKLAAIREEIASYADRLDGSSPVADAEASDPDGFVFHAKDSVEAAEVAGFFTGSE